MGRSAEKSGGPAGAAVVADSTGAAVVGVTASVDAGAAPTACDVDGAEPVIAGAVVAGAWVVVVSSEPPQLAVTSAAAAANAPIVPRTVIAPVWPRRPREAALDCS